MSNKLIMLAREFDPKHIKFPVAYEEKYDGIRIFFKDGHGYTRNGKTYETLDPIGGIFLEHGLSSQTCLDTEVYGRNWNETPHLVKRKHDIEIDEIKKHLTITIFDIFGDDIDPRYTYQDRREILKGLIKKLDTQGYKINIAKSRIAKNQAGLDAALEKVLNKGGEGLMVKALDGIYEKKRSWAWQKIKPFKDITVTITGYECSEGLCPTCSMKVSTGVKEGCLTCNGTGEVSYPNSLGTFICDYEGEEIRCGSGIDDQTRLDLMAQGDALIGKKADIKIQDDRSANEISARHPIWLNRFRDDI